MDNGDTGQARWNELCALEEAARATYLASKDERTDQELRSIARNWWGTVEAVLRHYAREMAYERHYALEPKPYRLLWDLHEIAGHLAVGNVTPTIQDVVGRDTAATGPAERLHISWATGYLKLAEQGEISDPSPVKTVMQHYGVRRQTAQRWAKLPLHEDVSAALSSPDAMPFHIKDKGAIYRKHGRSTVALASRADKPGDAN